MEGGQIRTRARNSPTYFRSELELKELKEPGGTRREELGAGGETAASGVFTLYYFLQIYSSPPFSVRFNSKESAYCSALSSPSKGLQRRGHPDTYSLSTCLPYNRVLQAHPSAHPLTVCEALERQHSGNEPELRLHEYRSQHH